jgi:type IV secretion system protein TrbJ
MSMRCSIFMRTGRRSLRAIGGAVLALALACAAPAGAQQIVFDPRNHLENALQAARQLESLANEARALAASPYSHLMESDRSLRDMAELARTARGLAGQAEALERQFETLYPDVRSLDARTVYREGLARQGEARLDTARRTAGDVARLAADLERLGEARTTRVAGALRASETAPGQTSATQSTNQMLAVLAEEMAGLRTILLAQARLMAEQTARESADREAGEALRRARWSGGPRAVPRPPAFDPLARARE